VLRCPRRSSGGDLLIDAFASAASDVVKPGSPDDALASGRRGPDRPVATAVSAVIINFNGGDRAVACVRALMAHGQGIAEIILVDNDSADGSRERVLAACPAARLIRLAGNPGPAVARNRGLEAASCDLALLVDGDTLLTAPALAELDRARRRFRATVVCPRLVLAPDEQVVQCDGAAPHFIGTLALLGANAPAADRPAAHEVNGLISACLLVDRRRTLAAGGFNETYFFYFEDLEFALRLRLLGHVIACAPAAVVVHDRGEGAHGLAFRGTGRYPPQRAYYTMRNRLLTIATCFHWRTIAALLPALIVYEAATLGLVLARGWFGLWLGSWGWMIAHAGEVARQRRAIQTRRRLPDRVVLAGGPLPLAAGLLASRRSVRIAAAVSRLLDAYWQVARVLAG